MSYNICVNGVYSAVNSGKVIQRITEYAKGLRLGPGIEPDTDLGPIIGEQYRRKIEAQIAEAKPWWYPYAKK